MSSRKRFHKIIIIGDSGVGKTSLMRYCPYRCTIGADFCTKDVSFDGKEITLQIWDTFGQDRLQTLGSAFYRATDCCVLVYDITDPKSFEDLAEWRSEFLNQGNISDPQSFPFVVIGNKSGKTKEQKVQFEQVQQWCKYVGKQTIPCFECSAKENFNVETAFQEIALQAASYHEEDKFEPDHIYLRQHNSQRKGKQKGCC